MADQKERGVEEVVDAMLALAAERGWRAVSLAAIAAKAGISLKELRQRFGGKGALLEAYARRLDDAMVTGDACAPDEPVRDRLFEVIMRRFEALQANRLSVHSIIRNTIADPWMWQGGRHHVFRTAALMLETAGLSSWGPAGRLKVRALSLIYLSVLRKWIYDDSSDMANTMANLDRALRRAESIALRLWPQPCSRLPADEEKPTTKA